jgi:hypothetical protein
MDDSLVAVSIGNGLVVWHTREEWDYFMRAWTGTLSRACRAT